MKQLLRIFLLLVPLVFLSSPCYPQAAGHYVTRKPKPAQKKSATPSKPKTQKATPAKPQAKAKPSTRSASPSVQRGMSEAEKTRVIQQLVNNMVYVEGGTFMMGATSEQVSCAYNDDAKPVHRVTVSSFYIGKYEVTQREWEAVMGRNPSENKGANCPVECVSWDDCQNFIAKLNRITGKHFRLPTEAEWEYAARGGNRSQGYEFAGSNYFNEVAWCRDNSGHTHDVGTKRPNELGLYDMSGNVSEWCSDWYGSYSSASQTNPTGSSSESERVHRGGSWVRTAGACCVSARERYHSHWSFEFIGLRLVLF